jgi:acetyltransferase
MDPYDILSIHLDDGTRLAVRPLIAADRPLLLAAFEASSSTSRYHRFFTPLRELQPWHLDRLTDLDEVNRFAWAAVAADGDAERLVAVARYFCLDDPTSAEIAVAVIDEFQDRGLGTIMLWALAQRASDVGIHRFEGLVLRENLRMLRLLRKAGARLQGDGAGTLAFTVDLPMAS